jgi:RNA polymerase sigma-70 factor (ECF subfamily)
VWQRWEASVLVREPEPATIAAAAAGDREAFVELVQLYQLPVWRFLTRLVNDAALAEDITQDTFVRVHRGLPAFHGRSRFSTWVFGIARNAGLDAIRHQQRRPQVVGELPTEMAARAEVGARLEIQAALASLPVRQREALLMVEVLGLTYREASSLAAVAEGTIKSRVYYARVHLHQWMNEGAQADEL